MKLGSADGGLVDLRPLGYEFADVAADDPDDWDANWLVVAGRVRLPDGRAWSFLQPCLTTSEAQALGDWLRAVVAGQVRPTALERDADETLELFTEPNIALSLAARSEKSAVVRLHLSLESRPPWLGDDAAMYDFFVSLDLSLSELAAAVDDWDRELAAFPGR